MRENIKVYPVAPLHPAGVVAGRLRGSPYNARLGEDHFVTTSARIIPVLSTTTKPQ